MDQDQQEGRMEFQLPTWQFHLMVMVFVFCFTIGVIEVVTTLARAAF